MKTRKIFAILLSLAFMLSFIPMAQAHITITANLEDITVFENEEVTLHFRVRDGSGTGRTTFTWQRSEDGGENWLRFQGQNNTATATFTADSFMNGDMFRATAHNSVTRAQIFSREITLTVNPAAPAPSINQQPQSQTLAEGQHARFSVGVDNPNGSGINAAVFANAGFLPFDTVAAEVTEITLNNPAVTSASTSEIILAHGTDIADFAIDWVTIVTAPPEAAGAVETDIIGTGAERILQITIPEDVTDPPEWLAMVNTRNVTVRVADPPPPPDLTAITISGLNTVAVGANIPLSATPAPPNALLTGITWNSATPAVATVNNNGVVTGVASGTTAITATAGSITSATFTVTVTAAPTPATPATITRIELADIAPDGTTITGTGNTRTVTLPHGTALSEFNNNMLTITTNPAAAAPAIATTNNGATHTISIVADTQTPQRWLAMAEDIVVTVRVAEAEAPAFTITSAASASVARNATFQVTATANTTSAPTFERTGTPAWPTGVSMTSAGLISVGPNVTLGVHPAVTITATSGTGANARTATQQFTLTVTAAATSATADNITIGNAGGDVIINLTSDMFATTLSGTNGWIQNLPAGMTQTAIRVNDTRVRIEIRGTPTAASTAIMEIVIPAASLQARTTNLSVTRNDNARFNTTAGTVTGTGLSATPGTVTFGPVTAAPTYTQPTAQTITITNTSTASITLNALPTVEGYTLSPGANWTTAFAQGATRTFTIRPVTGLSAGTHNRTFAVTGSNNSTVNITANFTVNGITIASHPLNRATVEGRSVSFEIVANAHPAPTFQWQRRTSATGTWENVTTTLYPQATGITSATLTIPSVTTAMNGHQFRAVITSGGTNVESNAATLTVNPATTDNIAIADAMEWLTWERIRGTNAAAGAAPHTAATNLSLPTVFEYRPNDTANHRDVTITWHSSQTSRISAAGAVSPQAAANVTGDARDPLTTMTAVFTTGGVTNTAHANNPNTRAFNIRTRHPTNAEAVTAAAAEITWNTIRGQNTNENEVTTNLTLSTTGPYGTTVSWASNNAAAITAAGVVTRQANRVSVRLTATISRNRTDNQAGASSSQNKDFNLQTAGDPGFTVTTTATGVTGTISGTEFLGLNANGTRAVPVTLGSHTINFDAAAARTIGQAATGAGANVTITIETATVPATQSQLVGNRPAFSINIVSGTSNITNLGGNATIRLSHTIGNDDPHATFVQSLAANAATLTNVRSYFDSAANRVIFPTNQVASLFVVAHNPEVEGLVDAGEINHAWNGGARQHISFVMARALYRGNLLPGNTRSFNYNSTMTRAQFVAVLANYDGVGQGFTSFPAQHIDWAEGLGIFGTTASARIEPNNPITRADMAYWLYNYIRARNVELGNVGGISLQFADVSTVNMSQGHVNAINALANAGIEGVQDSRIISGFPDGTFRPAATSTRAEVAAIIAEFVRAFN